MNLTKEQPPAKYTLELDQSELHELHRDLKALSRGTHDYVDATGRVVAAFGFGNALSQLHILVREHA